MLDLTPFSGHQERSVEAEAAAMRLHGASRNPGQSAACEGRWRSGVFLRCFLPLHRPRMPAGPARGCSVLAALRPASRGASLFSPSFRSCPPAPPLTKDGNPVPTNLDHNAQPHSQKNVFLTPRCRERLKSFMLLSLSLLPCCGFSQASGARGPTLPGAPRGPQAKTGRLLKCA